MNSRIVHSNVEYLNKKIHFYLVILFVFICKKLYNREIILHLNVHEKHFEQNILRLFNIIYNYVLNLILF